MLAVFTRTRQSRVFLRQGLSAAKGNVEKAAAEGLKFFADLSQRGNLVPVVGSTQLLKQGVTPILIRWHYLGLGDRDRLKGTTDISVVIPKSGVVAGVYVQAISAFAPHPNAARLWMEHLFSDDAQLAWLSGGCHPIRIADLKRRGTIPLEGPDGVQLGDLDGYRMSIPFFQRLISRKKRETSSPMAGTQSSE